MGVLAQMVQTAKGLAQNNPRLSAIMTDIVQKIQEAQTELAMQRAGPSPLENPPL